MSFKTVVVQIAVALARFATVTKESSNELEHIRELYRREALQRKLLYNKVSVSTAKAEYYVKRPVSALNRKLLCKKNICICTATTNQCSS